MKSRHCSLSFIIFFLHFGLEIFEWEICGDKFEGVSGQNPNKHIVIPHIVGIHTCVRPSYDSYSHQMQFWKDDRRTNHNVIDTY